MNQNLEYNVLDWCYVHVIRLTLETRTPLSVGQGSGDGVFDNLLVVDANGLAAIPGSSFAGVLRHLYRQHYDAQDADILFGNGGDEASPSRVRVSWGCLHDSRDQPVEGLLLSDAREQLFSDQLLLDASCNVPLKRDRVRIDNRGTAASQGQFDRVALRAGHRFSLELCLWETSADRDSRHKLLALLSSPMFRLGGGTRSGFGALAIIRLHHRFYNLKDKADFAAYCALKPNLNEVTGFKPAMPQPEKEPARARIVLKPEDFFRFGQGTQPLKSHGDKDPGLLPVTEKTVLWDEAGGRLSERKLLLPATAIKGALRHRVAFHHNCAQGRFAEDANDCTTEAFATENNEAVRALFGMAAGDGSGQTGVVLLDDLFLDPQSSAHLMHNGIDRFTGGVRDHVLYAEEVVDAPQLVLVLTVLENEAPKHARDALARSLDDLVGGNLALGAGAARGHGYFRGSCQWNEAGEAWLKGGKP